MKRNLKIKLIHKITRKRDIENCNKLFYFASKCNKNLIVILNQLKYAYNDTLIIFKHDSNYSFIEFGGINEKRWNIRFNFENCFYIHKLNSNISIDINTEFLKYFREQLNLWKC